jgi:hypothetical protein
MTEPIKLPNMPFDLYQGIQDCDQYNAIRKYTTDAVEQATADLRRDLIDATNDKAQMQHEINALLARAEKAEGYAEHLLTEARRTADVMAQVEAERDEALKATADLRAELQTYIGLAARRNICLKLVEDVLNDPEYDASSIDMEYWDSLHDLAQKVGRDRDEARAELARLTTLRPASEWDRETIVVWYLLIGYEWIPCGLADGTHWTPLPIVKEAP